MTPAVSKAELMLHCRVDDDTVGDYLMTLQAAAEGYLRTAGAYKPQAPTYTLAVKAMVLHMYDHPAGGEAHGAGLQALINQLKHT